MAEWKVKIQELKTKGKGDRNFPSRDPPYGYGCRGFLCCPRRCEKHRQPESGAFVSCQPKDLSHIPLRLPLPQSKTNFKTGWIETVDFEASMARAGFQATGWRGRELLWLWLGLEGLVGETCHPRRERIDLRRADLPRGL